jgi:hypothetical protein
VRARAALALAMALAATAAAAQTAHACDAYRHASAVHLKPKRERAPLIIGDSTMIYAAPYLGRRGFEADAKGCRQFTAGVGMLAQRRHRNRLPRIAILALGANGQIARGTIERALAIMGSRRVLGLVTPRRAPQSAGAIRSAAHRYPDRLLLIDWLAYSAAHGGWFAGDGLHVNFAGAKAFAQLVRRKVRPLVAPPVGRLKLPSSTDGAKACGSIRHSRRRLRVYVPRGAPRVKCRRARQLARKPRLRPIPRWRYYDWSASGKRPWSDVYVRHDRKVIVATVR